MKIEWNRRKKEKEKKRERNPTLIMEKKAAAFEKSAIHETPICICQKEKHVRDRVLLRQML
jgi:hypothetical protein